MLQASTIADLADKLEKSFQKALEQKPEIEVIEFGLYRVRGSKGNWYEVRIGVTSDGEYFVACLCLGSLHTGYCWHCAVAFARHQIIRYELILQKERGKVDWAKVPYLKSGTGKYVRSYWKNCSCDSMRFCRRMGLFVVLALVCNSRF